MRTATGQWFDMVNLLRRGKPPGLAAFLAEWMRRNIPVTNPLPCPAIPALAFRRPLVPVILRRNDLLVFLTIPPVCQARAARIGAGALRFIWHSCRLLPWHKKSPHRFIPAKAAVFFLNCYCNTIRPEGCLSMSFSVLFEKNPIVITISL